MEEARRLEEEYDEKLRIEREKLQDEYSREDRLKAREVIRELRSQRLIEKELKASGNVCQFSHLLLPR